MSDLMSHIKFQQVWIYSEPIDFRKQINGLVDVVLGVLEKEPDNGDMYIFRNRRSNRIKMLLWDRNGYFCGLKRLEKGKFDFPESSGSVQITESEMSSIISGMPMVRFSSEKKPIYTH